ncbi:hypothetical protein K402DRAFT_396159 [Aulographum hederae CBS 113979]|uniref:Carboxymuconolactone decarboxylase-like domain-containing protein n=1 Tax=Aulographum hederae CBS 113979 TaxID=1176131 RepID=A0A6G1GSK5_9PEZI|nr:hypothetical protein K402DRAFT_396159 [Aulographum hederae CBS 113979]
MRLPYAPPTPPSPSLQALYTRIATRRHPRPLIPLDLTLLHSPPVADGWNSFIGAVRTQTLVSAQLNELAIARVAVLNQAGHEWSVHARLALREGVGRKGLERVLGRGCVARAPGEDRGGAEAGTEAGTEAETEDESWGTDLTKTQIAVLNYTDYMTRAVRVPDAVFEQVRLALGGDERLVVELTATVAAYNCVSRFLVALDVGEENGKGLEEVGELVG